MICFTPAAGGSACAAARWPLSRSLLQTVIASMQLPDSLDNLFDIPHLLRAVLLVQLRVGGLLEIVVHALEQVLEQQPQQPARQIQTLVAVVVPALESMVRVKRRTEAIAIQNSSPSSLPARSSRACCQCDPWHQN